MINAKNKGYYRSMPGVFIITTSYGGAEKLLINLLQKAERSVVLITNDEVMRFFKEGIKNKRVKIISVGTYRLPKITLFRRLKKIFYWFYYAVALSRLLQAYPISCLDVHLEVGMLSAAIYKRFFQKKIHLNLNCHGYEVRRSLAGGHIPYYHHSEIQYCYFDWALKYYDSFIFYHQEVQEESKKIQQINKKPGRLIHPGVDIKHYRPQRKTPFSIGFMGRLVASKQPEMVIKIAPYIIREFPQARFHIIGKGELGAKLKKEVRAAGLNGHIRFYGELEDTAKVLNKTQFFLSLQTIGNFGSIALFEAMASGCVCFATKTPEWQTVPKNLICFVDKNNPEKIASEIIRLIRSCPSGGRLADNARKFVVKERSVNKMAHDYFEFLQNALSLL